MTTTAKAIIETKRANDTLATEYTCSVLKTIVDTFTATNTTASNATISVNLVPQGVSVGDSNCVVHEKILTPGQIYRAYSVIGQTLEEGDSISVVSNTADAVTIRSSGREIT